MFDFRYIFRSNQQRQTLQSYPSLNTKSVCRVMKDKPTQINTGNVQVNDMQVMQKRGTLLFF